MRMQLLAGSASVQQEKNSNGMPEGGTGPPCLGHNKDDSLHNSLAQVQKIEAHPDQVLRQWTWPEWPADQPGSLFLPLLSCKLADL